ncbi:hypothetical protein FCN77_05740 [Arthrobacter sp. 24S4-2]|uniref:hypothetical protein n=1 Tax=Arthrobacter sp. 24S4-2 TaxID=2575374 RepID=UPI0010C78BF8|nr:hypothetical protein [Arthrobacter sp. 24S4-2]QCO97308.1 hypothetical protein FCN77_05740 [Arthrobacter sp. 24S4-2]
MYSMSGQASREIDGDIANVWAEAITLQWLNGWDSVLISDPPAPGGDFWLIDDGHRIRCKWTRVVPQRILEWLGDNGEAGRLSLRDAGQRTSVSYDAVYVAQAVADSAIAGFLNIVARGKMQRDSNNHANNELNSLSFRVARRLKGNPVDDNAGRRMLEICEFGMQTTDPDVVPLLDAEGRLILADDEQVVWSGDATTAAAEDATAAAGREQWRTLWDSPETAHLTLTTKRLVYVIPQFTRADGSWIIVGGLAGAALVGASALRARWQRNGRALAGQIRHLHLLNLITGPNSRPTFSSPATVTATMLQLPDRLLRVSLTATHGPDQALELARIWTKAACADRLGRFAYLEGSQSDKWKELQAQYVDPSSTNHFYGDLWGLPLGCALTRNHPYGLP